MSYHDFVRLVRSLILDSFGNTHSCTTMRLVALLHSQEGQHGGYREDKNCKEHKDAIGLGRPTPRYHNFRVGEPVPALIIAAATTIEDVVEDYLGSTMVIYVTIAVHTRDLDSEYLCCCQSKQSVEESRPFRPKLALTIPPAALMRATKASMIKPTMPSRKVKNRAATPKAAPKIVTPPTKAENPKLAGRLPQW